MPPANPPDPYPSEPPGALPAQPPPSRTARCAEWPRTIAHTRAQVAPAHHDSVPPLPAQSGDRVSVPPQPARLFSSSLLNPSNIETVNNNTTLLLHYCCTQCSGIYILLSGFAVVDGSFDVI